VIIERVLGREDRSDATLSVASVSFTRLALREERDGVTRASSLQRCHTSSGSTANNDEVEGVGGHPAGVVFAEGTIREK
jgi:hypothetical protein